MKIGILTWFKALNHGAVLQAYASHQIMKKWGYNPLMLDYQRTMKNRRNKREQFFRKIYKFISGDFKYRKIYSSMIKEKQEKFDSFISNRINRGPNCYNEKCDCIMIGSDMVFNLLQGFSPYMFGIGLKCNYVFSYAASSGGSTVKLAEELAIKKQIEEAINKFRGLGCRDQSTKNFIKDISERQDLEDTIDPVLLYGFEEEKNTWDTGKWKTHAPYVLIYSYFGDMNKKSEYKEIKKYAAENNLEIISCGYYHPWCDENINADPQEFFDMFCNAKIVITDTFHGTVFSLITHKPFCSIVRGNGFKLRYLLEECHLEDRIAEKATNISNVLNLKMDYIYFENWISQEREKSSHYILTHLHLAEKEIKL